MQTISELNKKWWYRLTKVIYFITLFIVIVIPVWIMWVQSAPTFDISKSYVECNNGLKLDSNTLSTKGVFLYDNFIPYESENKVRFLCASDSDIAEIARKAYPNGYSSLSDEVIASIMRANQDAFLEHATISSVNYRIVSIYTSRDWQSMLGYSAVIIVSVALLFEAIRRIFYYVFLGKIRPSKS
ncbi:MAG: hypothetical protein JWL75_648 [Parcubacteria group bacterium]|nr:hypothetical protein [Parcubacteria group bacterium]